MLYIRARSSSCKSLKLVIKIMVVVKIFVFSFFTVPFLFRIRLCKQFMKKNIFRGFIQYLIIKPLVGHVSFPKPKIGFISISKFYLSFLF